MNCRGVRTILMPRWSELRVDVRIYTRNRLGGRTYHGGSHSRDSGHELCGSSGHAIPTGHDGGSLLKN